MYLTKDYQVEAPMTQDRVDLEKLRSPPSIRPLEMTETKVLNLLVK